MVASGHVTRALTLVGAELETTTRKVERPCIGLCYLAKIGAVPSSTPPPLPELEAEVEGAEYEEAAESGDYGEVLEEDYAGSYESL